MLWVVWCGVMVRRRSGQSECGEGKVWWGWGRRLGVWCGALPLRHRKPHHAVSACAWFGVVVPEGAERVRWVRVRGVMVRCRSGQSKCGEGKKVWWWWGRRLGAWCGVWCGAAA